MKNIFLSACLFISLAFSYQVDNTEELNRRYLQFQKFYESGNFISAERVLYSFFELTLKEYEKSSAYNNLGSTNILLGRYDKAIEYYSLAERIAISNNSSKRVFAAIYINKAIIYSIKKSQPRAIEFFEKGLRLYQEDGDDRSVASEVAKAYRHLGISHHNMKDYKKALAYLQKSLDLIEQTNPEDRKFVMMNLAKTYAGLNNYPEADNFFRRGIKTAIEEKGSGYFRLAEFYSSYGEFLQETGKTAEARRILGKSLEICLKTHGEKNFNTSRVYKKLGDLHLEARSFDSSLYYYQKSLISVVKDFNEHDVSMNPGTDSSLFDFYLLDNLKGKSLAFELKARSLSDENEKMKIMSLSLGTLELAINLIEILRKNNPSEENLVYLSENEKETYISAIRIASGIYSLSGDDSLIMTGYNLSQRAKSSLLQDQIAGNALLSSSSLPDSLLQRQKLLSSDIAAYNRQIIRELEFPAPNSVKISFWKDAIFEMKRQKERIDRIIADSIPKYRELFSKAKPASLSEIQGYLKIDEVIMDYFLSDPYEDGKRKLYIFVINRNGLSFREVELDGNFKENAILLTNTSDPGRNDIPGFAQYTTALYYMYRNLVLPVEDLVAGKRLIVIPDEEIGWLPFEAFLKTPPDPGKTDFEQLDFLIYDYSVSYCYSSSLYNHTQNLKKSGVKVFSFSPSYGPESELESLGGALSEISSIKTYFRGDSFANRDATKSNFLNATRRPAIFHLAMHSIADSLNSLYSYMQFDPENTGEDNGRLYNYEISLSNLQSPMIVLSSCNSGTGVLYSGEGVMSLARSFILAGASSVVRTAWEINDDSGSEIIARFYKHLSKGVDKDEALRLAKIEFMRESSPAYSHPYYWAAYEVVGDNGPVTINKTIVNVIAVLLVIVAAGGVLAYLRRRRIFSDSSL